MATYVPNCPEQIGLDEVLQDAAAPALGHGTGGVPVALLTGGQPVEEHRDMPPGQSFTNVVNEFLRSRPRLRRLAHVVQVRSREATLAWKFRSQVR
jgi:hypothetical protein